MIDGAELMSIVLDLEGSNARIAADNALKASLFRQADRDGLGRLLRAAVGSRRLGSTPHVVVPQVSKIAQPAPKFAPPAPKFLRTTHHMMQAFPPRFAQILSPSWQRKTRVYFAVDDARGLIKIGLSNDVRVRIRTLEAGCKGALRLLGSIDGNRATEIRHHQRFAHLHHAGEWFRSTPAALAEIAELILASEAT